MSPNNENLQDPGELSDDNRIDPQRTAPLSRREFLRAIGAASLGAVAANLAVPPLAAAAFAADKMDLNHARLIASQSPLFREAREKLGRRGFEFNLDQSGFSRASSHPGLEKYTAVVGLSLPNLSVKDRQVVADIMLTVDLKAQGVTGIEYSVARSTESGLDLYTVNLQPDKPPHETSELMPRADAALRRGPAIGQVDNSAPTKNQNAASLDVPCEDRSYRECTQWYLNNCYTHDWCCCGFGVYMCGPQYKCQCVIEYRNCRNCYTTADCTSGCDPWYSEWRDYCRLCSYYGCWDY